MDIPDWADDHWIALYFGFDLILFFIAVLLWKPGTRPFAGLVFVFALLLPIAFLTVLFTNLILEDEPAGDRRTDR